MITFLLQGFAFLSLRPLKASQNVFGAPRFNVFYANAVLNQRH